VLKVFTASFCATLQSQCEVNLLTALLMSSCGKLSQITCSASLNSVIDWVLNGACDRSPGSHPRHGSPCVRRMWRPLVLSDEFLAVDLKPFLCDECLSLIAVTERDTMKFNRILLILLLTN